MTENVKFERKRTLYSFTPCINKIKPTLVIGPTSLETTVPNRKFIRCNAITVSSDR